MDGRIKKIATAMLCVILGAVGTLGLLILLTGLVEASGRLHTEDYYVREVCPGVQEYPLPDKTRIDCLTETRAWEYDFAEKWYEAIGQSLWYSANTARRAGVMLIVEKDSQIKYVHRAIRLVEHFNLPIEVQYWDARQR